MAESIRLVKKLEQIKRQTIKFNKRTNDNYQGILTGII